MRALLILVALVTTIHAQQTWAIGNGQAFPTIDAAMASPSVQHGDTLQCVASSLPNFTLTKGVTVRGPTTIFDASSTSCQSRILVTPGQQARLVDVGFQPCYGPSGNFGGVVATGSSVVLERCQVRSPFEATGGRSSFIDCTFTVGSTGSGPTALGLVGGDATLLRCTLTGCLGSPPWSSTAVPRSRSSLRRRPVGRTGAPRRSSSSRSGS